MKYTEEHKRTALSLAFILNIGYYWKSYSDQLFKNKKDFIKCCSLYFDNREDFNTVSFVLNNGVGYARGSKELYAKFCSALVKNKQIPLAAREEIDEQFQRLRHPIQVESTIKKEPKPTRIYLMINQRNGLYKIGRSVKPTVREHTLQSDEPEINLLRTWLGTHNDEIYLHEIFSSSRVRGEWFRLSDEQIEKLYKIMDNQTANSKGSLTLSPIDTEAVSDTE